MKTVILHEVTLYYKSSDGLSERARLLLNQLVRRYMKNVKYRHYQAQMTTDKALIFCDRITRFVEKYVRDPVRFEASVWIGAELFLDIHYPQFAKAA